MNDQQQDTSQQHTSANSVPPIPIDAPQLEVLLHLHYDVLDALPLLITIAQIPSRSEIRILFVNRRGLERSGFKRADLIGKRVEEFFPQDQAARLYERFHKVLDSGTSLEMEDVYTTPKGQMWVRGRYIPLPDADGQITRIAIVTQDITELKLRELAELEQREIIAQQSAAIAELSTPLLTISDKAVVMPLIGAVDSRRISQIMETLLSGVALRQASFVIVDITGVPIVDTQVASALIRAAQAVGLLGARVVLTGIRPEIAQTLVGLGVDLQGLITRGTLQDGIAYSLAKSHN